MSDFIISSFFVKSLKKQTSLIHGTSPRYFNIGQSRKEPFCPNKKHDRELFSDHKSYFLQSLGIKKKVLFSVNQVHGNNVYILKDRTASVDYVAQQEADAIVTHLPDYPIMILTADCVPIIIYDPIKCVVGVVHAGRIGTQKGVFLKTIKVLADEYGSLPEDLLVGMGPAIGGCCYEVDESCALPFIKKSSLSARFLRKSGRKKYFVDLPEANRIEGCQAGIPEENIYTDGPCTSCDNHLWYSYRKEGETGRLMTIAMLRLKQ